MLVNATQHNWLTSERTLFERSTSCDAWITTVPVWSLKMQSITLSSPWTGTELFNRDQTKERKYRPPHYNLRPRAHSLQQQLPEHLTQLSDSNFLTRMLYKRVIWRLFIMTL